MKKERQTTDHLNDILYAISKLKGVYRWFNL